MVFWQLTIDANDPAELARFWAQALGYQPVPPTEPATTWHALYHARLEEDAAFDDRLFDPAGLKRPHRADVIGCGLNHLGFFCLGGSVATYSRARSTQPAATSGVSRQAGGRLR